MDAKPRSPLRRGPLGVLLGFASRLRFPWLAALTAALFLADLVIPDVLPIADEVLLGLATVLLASWKDHRQARRDGAGAGPGGTGSAAA